MTNFFYVYKIGGQRPTFKHPTFNQAVTEAQRLVDTIGGEYEILEAKAIVKAAPKYVVEMLDYSPWTAQQMGVAWPAQYPGFEPPF